MTDSLLVEFVGLSGSGKSTLAKALAVQLEMLGVTGSFRGESLIDSDARSCSTTEIRPWNRFCVCWPPSTGALAFLDSIPIATLILKTWLRERTVNPPHQGRLSAHIPSLYFAVTSVVRNNIMRRRVLRKKGVAILDEGSMHEIWWYLLRLKPTATARAIETLVSRKYKSPTLLVFVFSDVEVISARLLERPRTPNTKHWLHNGSSLEAWMNNLLLTYETTSTLSFHSSGLWIKKFSNTERSNIKKVAEDIAVTVADIMRGA